MRRFAVVLTLAAIVAILAVVPSNGPFAQNGSKSQSVSSHQYEVLSPWAEVDPKPVRGISPRLTTLAGKNIGLFANYKRASVPIVKEVEKRLKERYPDIKTSLLHSTDWNVIEAEHNPSSFKLWAKGLDAAVVAVGD